MLRFSNIHRAESDDWHSEGPFLTSPETLEKLESLIDQGRTLIAEHWHYRGSRAPDRQVIEHVEDFLDYLKDNAIAGDIVDVFDITAAWQEKGKPVVSGKCPDDRGEVPRKGAY
jgi:hypothetical protein